MIEGAHTDCISEVIVSGFAFRVDAGKRSVG